MVNSDGFFSQPALFCFVSLKNSVLLTVPLYSLVLQKKIFSFYIALLFWNLKCRENQMFFEWHPKARVVLDVYVCHLVMAVHFVFLCNLTVGVTRVFTVMWFLLFNLHFVLEVGFNTASLTRAQLITQQRDFIT